MDDAMVRLEDKHSLAEFQQQTDHLLRELRETGRPALLTVDGKPELVVQSAEGYQKLLELVDRLETIEAVRRGIESVNRGGASPAAEVFERIRRRAESEPGR